MKAGRKRARLAVAAVGIHALAAALAGCASSVGNTPTVLADPGLYEFYPCDQLVNFKKVHEERRRELRALIDKAEQSPAGAVIGVMSYRIDYAAAAEEIKVIEATQRAKNCPPPPTWRSTTAIR